jgi:hypothetical protein
MRASLRAARTPFKPMAARRRLQLVKVNPQGFG